MRINFKIPFVISIFLLLTSQGFAQTQSPLGRFEVDVDRGCAGFTLNINELFPFDTISNILYFYEGTGGGQEGSALSHQYNTAGEFYLVQIYPSNDSLPSPNIDSLLITVLEPQLPEFIVHNCDNHNVRVEITEDYYDRYQVKFNNTDSVEVDPLSFSDPYDYTTQGSYRIEVSGLLTNGDDDLCGISDQTINTINAITVPAIVSVETQQNHTNGSITVNHDLGDDIVYNINSSTNSANDFMFLQTISGTSTDILGANTSNDYFCYLLDTYDACNEISIQSDTVCSVLFGVSTADDGNLISWTTEQSLATEYNVLRDGNLLYNENDPTIPSFLDTAVICNQPYDYNVQAIFRSGFSLGIDTGVVATQSGLLPQITDNPSSTVSNQEVVLQWRPPDTGAIPFSNYIVQKNVNNRGWRNTGTTSDTTFTDVNATFNGTHSYRIRYSDDCDNIADASPITDPIIVRQVSVRGRVVSYRWNRYETWLQGIRGYTLERLDSAGNVSEEFPVLSGREWEIEFSPNDLTDKLIRVRAESLDDTPLFSYSNVITTALKTEMFLPTAFTPDGDDLNDTFFAKGPAVFNFKMEIYNRWGNLIYVTNDNLNGWDGTINGEDAAEETYIYKIFFEDGEGRQYDQTGAFRLLRNSGQ